MINLLLSESRRSEIYLNYIQKYNIRISKIIYYGKNKQNVNEIIESKNLVRKTLFVRSNTVNSPLIEKAILQINDDIPTIFSGYSGEIIKNKIVLKKNLIHFHPGDLPSYKGSTTIF